ncbi:MAG: GNAT family N-acetyltransferase [bacterium]
MEIREIFDREKIKAFLLEDPYQHLYEIGNLNEKLFTRSKWFCALENNEIKAVAMVHIAQASDDNFLFLLENKNTKEAAILLSEIKAKLPNAFNAHLISETAALLKPEYEISNLVKYNKMKIIGNIMVDKAIKYSEYTYRVNKNDFEVINDFLRSINPLAFFVPAMLETGKYFIIRKNSDLIAMAGVHFYSKEIGIAVIGNVATAPEYRGMGYGSSVTASLLMDLWKDVSYIGLNVLSDNIPAIKVYEKLGFYYYSTHEEIKANKII